jgi:hypothetical protein
MENIMERSTKSLEVQSLIDLASAVLQKEMERQTNLYLEEIDKEINRRAEEKFQAKVVADSIKEQEDLCGIRRIVVTYNPSADVEDPDYVKLEVTPEDDAQGANDNIALLLAAAKRLAETCPPVDENVYGSDLLDLTNDYMFGLTLKKMIGGMFNGGH